MSESDEPSGLLDDVVIERAFGAANRGRIIDRYFEATAEATGADDAWKHVYRLLLWINPTISLAHCYESDKCQPGKAWYPRSLAFHAWLASALAVDPQELHSHLDFMFRAATPGLARLAAEEREAAAASALSSYEPGAMPLPGDDPELAEIIREALGDQLAMDEDQCRLLIEQIHTHFGLENKRKNLLGRGFEDVLAAIVRRLPGAEGWEVRPRASLQDIPGFTTHGRDLERAEVDLALWEPTGRRRRILVSSKWSVRADRERQFDSDFDDYSKANSGGRFEYVLVTNEFDAARLYAGSTRIRGNDYLFSQVVHVNPDGVLATYADQLSGALPSEIDQQPRGRKARYLPALISSGRLVSLSSFLRHALI